VEKLQAFDCHVHVRTGQRASSYEAGFQDAQRLFSSSVDADPVEYYRSRRMMAVVFDIDEETATGVKASNDDVAAIVRRSEGLFVGLGSVDPWKGVAAVQEAVRCHQLGLKGIKLMPITQRFFLNERRFYPLWDTCQSLGLILLVHTGTTAIGAGSPGGRGLQLKYGQPVPALDDVAADFPQLTIIAAHPGWPWHLELLAVARHKANVYIDLSGWSPKYLPEEVVRYLNSVMPDKFLFGSDYPLLTPERWLRDFAALPIKEAVRSKVLYENACRLFGVDPSRFAMQLDGSAGPAAT